MNAFKEINKNNIDELLRLIHQTRQEIASLGQEIALLAAGNELPTLLAQKVDALNERVNFLSELERKVDEWNDRLQKQAAYVAPERGELRKTAPDEWEWRVGGWDGLSFWIVKQGKYYYLEGEEHSREELSLMLGKDRYTKLGAAKKSLEEFVDFYLTCHKEAWHEINQEDN